MLMLMLKLILILMLIRIVWGSGGRGAEVAADEEVGDEVVID